MEFLVLRCGLLKSFEVVFLMKGHSVNKQDCHNEPLARLFYEREPASQNGFYIQPRDVQELQSVLTNNTQIRVMSAFFDFISAFSMDTSSIPTNLLHQSQVLVTKVCFLLLYCFSHLERSPKWRWDDSLPRC